MLDLLRTAPPRMRRMLIVDVAATLLATAVAIEFGFDEPSPHNTPRLVGVLLGMGGMLLLSVSYVLHHLSQERSASCTRLSFFRLRTTEPHQILQALPLLSMVSGVLLFTAAALYLTAIGPDRPLVILVVLFSAYGVLALVSVVHTSRFLHRYATEQAALAAQAQAAAVEAQLAALRSQMNPHFLFNALNTVASLVRTDPGSAETTVEHLAHVLRRTLDRSKRTWTTLQDEVEYLHAYLAVEQQRWGDRLRVRWEVDPSALDVPVPPMTLQPLVENALKHGIGNRIEGGTLEITATHSNGTLTMSVDDDGDGFAAHYDERTGLGNLRARLAAMFGDRSTLTVVPRDHGAKVVVQLPVNGRMDDAGPHR